MENPQAALQGLAERYLAEGEANQDFTDFVKEVIGEDAIEQLDALSDEDRTAALGELADAYAELLQDRDDEDGFGDDERAEGWGWTD